MYAAGGEAPKRRPREKKERPPWLKDAVCEDYKAGLKVKEIARKYRIANELVSEYLHEERLLAPKPKPEPEKKKKEASLPKTTPPSPAFHELCVWLLKAREILGHAPDESAITRIMEEVRYEKSAR